MTPSSSSHASGQAGQHPLQQSRDVIRSLKAEQDAKRSRSEKLADLMTGIFGTTWFLAANLIVFTLWIVLNAHIIPGLEPLDPFPFGLLTTIVSLEAIGLAIIVLISQNRSAKIADLREEVDLQVDMLAERELTKLLHIVCALAGKLEIDLTDDQELRQMLAPTSVSKIEHALEKQVIGSEKLPASETP